MAKKVQSHSTRQPSARERLPDKSSFEDLPKPRKLKGAPPSRMNMDGLDARSLLVWATIADECLDDPRGAMARVAADPINVGDVSKFITDLEKVCGRQIVSRAKPGNPLSSGKRRGGHLTWEGVLLADICACIEHLWSYFLSTNGGPRACQEFRPVKDVIFRLLDTEIRRESDRRAYGPPLNMLTPTDPVRPDRVSRHWAASRNEWMLQRKEMKLPQDHYIYRVDDTLGEHQELGSMLNRKRRREPVGR
jgi:hypothetical protein